MPRYRIVFFGTPEFAVPSLEALLGGPDVVAGVVCQADRPAGRGQQLRKPPVKVLAEARGVPVAQPLKLRSGDFLATLQAWAPDLIVVAAYGRLLPVATLDLPPLGCINVHASLLPKYRGAAPIQWAILCGEDVTGITIMRMNERMDEGDILLQRETSIGAEETFGELQKRLAVLGAKALSEALTELSAGSLKSVPQDHAAATLAPMIHKGDGAIDWSDSAAEVTRKVRAFNPWPSAFTGFAGKLLKIQRARPLAEVAGADPGTVIGVGQVIRVATGNGVLAVEELQLEGRRRLSAGEFSRGGALSVGSRFDDPRAAH